jgi:hypothetical protein
MFQSHSQRTSGGIIPVKIQVKTFSFDFFFKRYTSSANYQTNIFQSQDTGKEKKRFFIGLNSTKYLSGMSKIISLDKGTVFSAVWRRNPSTSYGD